MTLENQLNNKAFYEALLDTNDNNHPVHILGEAYLIEQKKEFSDLTSIRFAQGEVYFHNKDFEAAIFKWENISNELQPWAQKNTADAYYELGLLSNAEDIYKSIDTDNVTLTTEVALQLFSLYIEREKLDLADSMIKKAVSLNPDYPNVTDLARAFFEEQRKWDSAIDLAVNEALRTEDLHWFDILKTYVDKGFTKPLAPDYFPQALLGLYEVDQRRFELLVASVWDSYQNQDSFFSWLKVLNQLLMSIEVKRSDSWYEVSSRFKETYFDLIDGKYLLKRLESIIPDLLTNWIRVTYSAHTLIASASVLAWNEIFPSSISAAIVQDAEDLIHQASNQVDGLEESISLFESIAKWAKENELEVGHRQECIVRDLVDLRSQHILIAGTSGNGKDAFINTILGEDLMDESSSKVVVFKDHESILINDITDSEIRQVSDLPAFHELMDRRRNTEGTFIDFKLPSPFLYDNGITIMDTPCINGKCNGGNPLFQYLHTADSLLYVLSAGSPFTEKEHDILIQLKEEAPNIPVHFILNNMEQIANEKEAFQVVDQTSSSINYYFPSAKVFAFSSKYESRQQLKDLAEFIRSNFSDGDLKEERTEKLLFFIRKTITDLLKKRIEVENSLIESIKWNEEMSVKLNGAIHQLDDIESEKTTTIKRSYNKMKESMKQDIKETIPKLLKDCSSLINEGSDFGKIHLELNKEMNNRIQNYLQQTLLPKFNDSLQEWIAFARDEFTQSQNYLDEMSEGFNTMYGEERLKLACDFRVIEDWRRDADRMTSGVHLERVNILLRFTPSQFLLKSAGKLFGAIPQNKSMLYNKYKTFVENEDYNETTDLITSRFLRQFELFESALERDIALFFKNPIIALKEIVEDTKSEIDESNEMLSKMRSNPEMYRDPLSLFEVRLRQHEWMTIVGKRIHTM
jgi:GTPase Era involved in 16S rRNA processing/tetratricopeptide (TPR) repeat protein